MATYVKYQSFVEAVAEGSHNLGSDQLIVALTNTTPNVATHVKLADITAVSLTNSSSPNITTSTSAQTTGTYKLVVADLVLTASGDVGPFQWVVVYNGTSTDDLLICYYDYGSAITLHTGETFTCNFDGVNGLLQIT